MCNLMSLLNLEIKRRECERTSINGEGSVSMPVIWRRRDNGRYNTHYQITFTV